MSQGKLPEELRRARQDRARPLVADFEGWLRAALEKLSCVSYRAAATWFALKL
jgi:hypothetical protein